jgi:hypothetical protein
MGVATDPPPSHDGASLPHRAWHSTPWALARARQSGLQGSAAAPATLLFEGLNQGHARCTDGGE